MMVKVDSYLTKSEAAVHRCLQPFTEKHLFIWVSFLLKLQAYSLKKKAPLEMFSCECA